MVRWKHCILAPAVMLAWVDGHAQLAADGDQFLTQGEFAASAGDQFGTTLAAGDFNGDGYDDLAIASPLETADGVIEAGRVEVRFGSSAGLPSTGTVFSGTSYALFDQLDDDEDSARFGAALAVLDFNDDGFEDLAIGAPFEEGWVCLTGLCTFLQGHRVGYVRFFHGSESGLENTTRVIVPQAASSEAFGASIAAGDFDCDGSTDFAVGAPGDDLDDVGAVVLYLSTLEAEPVTLRQDDFVGTVEEGDRFGEVLRSGDFDGDGCADLAIGAPGENADAGAVNVAYGSPSGLERGELWQQNSPGIADSGEAEEFFGSALAVGDTNGDGFDELVIGAFGEGIGSEENAGAVHVLFGTSGGLDATGNQFFRQGAPLFGAPESNDFLGQALAMGDFDANGHVDLAIGVPREDFVASGSTAVVDAGIVFALYADNGGLGTSGEQFWSQDSAGIASDAENSEFFGLALESGDFNGDGTADLAVGVPFEDVIGFTGRMTFAGAVNVIYGVPVAGPPVPVDDSYSTSEDVLLTASDAEGTNASVADGLLANDGNLPVFEPLEIESPIGTFTAGGIGGTVDVDTDGTFSYRPPENGHGTAFFTYHATDGANIAAGQATIVVAPVNDPPQAQAAGSSTNEDSPSTLTLSGTDADGDALTFAIGAGPEHGSLGPVVPVADRSAEVIYTPNADFNGVDTFSFSVSDATLTSAQAAIEVTVDPVNDPPGFSAGGNVFGIEDAGFAQAWASDIVAGPPDELGQSVSFVVSGNSSPDLFASPPEIDPSGTLSFEPAVDLTGSATIEVVAMDDGGSANGGDPVSEPAAFTVDIIRAADLMIDKTSDSFFTQPGAAIRYTIVVFNPGPSNVAGAVVRDTPPSGLVNVEWTCTADPGAACSPAGSAVIDEAIDVPEGTGVTFQLDADLLDTVNGPITNEASVSAPTGVLELAPANNHDSDTDRIGLFFDSFETVEP